MKNNGWLIFLIWICLFIVHVLVGWVDDTAAVQLMLGALCVSFLVSSRTFINLPMLLVLSAVIQLLFAPLESTKMGLPFSLAQNFESEAYFNLAFSGIYALAFGVFWPRRSLKSELSSIDQWVLSLDDTVLLRWLMSAIVIMTLMPFLIRIPVIGAILDYVWKSIYPLALIFFLRRKWFVFYSICFLLLARSIVTSFFFEPGVFFLMGLMILIFLRRVRPVVAAMILGLMVPSIAVIQVAKGAFRAEVFGKSNLSTLEKMNLFAENFSDANSNEASELIDEGLLLRLNQGLYDSFVYRKGLNQENTIVPSFFSVFIPRTFWPDKPGFNNLKLRELGDYDSMGASFISISQVCESFSSWGHGLGVVFLLLYGLLLGTIVHFMSKNGGLIFFLTPIVFIHVIRVEADFVHVFSSLVHGGIAVWLISYLLKKNMGKNEMLTSDE